MSEALPALAPVKRRAKVWRCPEAPRARKHLKVWFRNTGVTQSEAALRLGLSTGARLSGILNGARNPSPSERPRIEAVTGIPAAWWEEGTHG